MSYDIDPLELTPTERLREVAALLARGLTRVHDRAGIPPDPVVEKTSESETNDLATPPAQSVTVHAG